MSRAVYHKPVLLKESIEYLSVRSGDNYIDATLGDAGHTLEILKRGGNVLGIDVDSDALERVRKRVEAEGWKNIRLVKGNFAEIDELAKKNGFDDVSGIIFDLGMSRYQLESSGRGFSFQKDEPLDMRMDPELSVRAMDLLNALTKKELYDLFDKLGEEKFSYRFAKAVLRRRELGAIKTTAELRELIYKNLPKGYRVGRIDPSTRVFQALRIAVNSELENLSKSLPRAVRLLKPQGRLVVISFHSLEDKIVKSYVLAERPKGVLKIITKKPVTPTEEEIKVNPRARSAKMRVVEKIK